MHETTNLFFGITPQKTSKAIPFCPKRRKDDLISRGFIDLISLKAEGETNRYKRDRATAEKIEHFNNQG